MMIETMDVVESNFDDVKSNFDDAKSNFDDEISIIFEFETSVEEENDDNKHHCNLSLEKDDNKYHCNMSLEKDCNNKMEDTDSSFCLFQFENELKFEENEFSIDDLL
jgi:hypothetical protein